MSRVNSGEESSAAAMAALLMESEVLSDTDEAAPPAATSTIRDTEYTFEDLIDLIGSEREHVAQRVGRVKAMIEKHPLFPMKEGRDGLRPLQHAVENDAPVEIIRVLARADPADITRIYMCEGVLRASVLRHTRTEEAFNCLVQEAIQYLDTLMHSKFQFPADSHRKPLQELFLSCCGKSGMVERLLRVFPDMNMDFSIMNKAVEERVSNEVLQELKELWYPRAFRDREDGDGYPPLHRVCRDWPDNEEAIMLLMSPEAVRAHDAGGRLPLHVYCDQDEVQLDLEIVQALARAYPESVRAKDGEGMTPLHHACWDELESRHDNLSVIRFLVESYPGGICESDGTQHTPLHLLCFSYHQGSPALLPAFRYFVEEHPETVLLSRSGKTPLHILCEVGCIENLPGIRIFLDAFPENGTVASSSGHTPLHLLCDHATDADLPLIRYAVERCPESAKMLDDHHCTPLHAACESLFRHDDSDDNLTVIQFLSEVYPGALKIRSKWSGKVVLETASGDTPLHMVCRHLYLEENTVVFLAGACPDVLEPLDDDSREDTPLHLICRGYYEHQDRPPLSYFKAFAVSEAAVKAKDSTGRTPLHLLCERGAPREILQVLFHKCQSLPKDDQGKTPLHALIEGYASGNYAFRPPECHEEGLECLLSAFSNSVFTKDDNGMTPFLQACEDSCASLGILYQLMRVDPLRLLGLERSGEPQSRKRKRDFGD